MFVLAAIILAACSGKKAQNPAAAAAAAGASHYSTMILHDTSAILESTYSATIRGRQDIDIYPQISGTLSRICVREGQRVSRGQVLFVIEQGTYRASVNQAAANIQACEAALSQAKLTLESKKNLYAKKVISDYELATAKNDVAKAEASLAQAKAQRDAAATNLSYTTITSPASGVVGSLPFRVGTLVGPTMTQALTTVSDNSQMYVYFSLNENQLLQLTRRYGSSDAALRNLPAVSLRLGDGSTYKHSGRIESISGVLDRTTGSASLRAVFPNSERLLLSGSTGNIIVPTTYNNCIIIPQTAATEIQDKILVYKVVNGKAQSTEITVSSLSDGQNYVVTSGLSAGDKIISTGAGMLRDGVKVE